MWDGQSVTVNLGSYTAGTATVVEIIWDTNNATASQRLRARRWTLGGSPPSFSDTATSSTAGTQDQQTSLQLGNSTTGYEIQFGRIIVSDDIAEDLSAVTEGEALDADYVSATAAGLLDSYEVPTYDDPGVNEGFIVRYRVKDTLGGAGVQVRLYEGTTLRSTGPTVYAAGEYQWNVPAADVANITDRAAVRVAVYSV
jgi:hypothetical protein